VEQHLVTLAAPPLRRAASSPGVGTPCSSLPLLLPPPQRPNGSAATR
jgi:hypothetical protein